MSKRGQAEEVKSTPDETTEQHKHAWRKYRETIHADNPKYDYRHAQAYFELQACEKCHEKRYTNLVLR